MLAHPDAVREVFAHGPDDLDSGIANRSLRPLLGTGNVLLLDGQEHLRRRKVVLPPFHGERMRAYEALMREVTRRELAAWPAGVPAPVLPHMQAITFRVVLRAVFGVAEEARLERLATLLRRFMAWSVDPRRGLIFTFLGPERFMALRAYRRQRDEVDARAAGRDRPAPRRRRPRRAHGHPLAAAAGHARGRQRRCRTASCATSSSRCSSRATRPRRRR